MLNITTNEQSNLPIKIDGKDYSLKSYSTLKFADYMRIQNFTDKYKNLVDLDFGKLDDKQIQELSDTMEGLVSLIAEDVPQDVLGLLNPMNKLAVINHFLETVPKEEIGTPTAKDFSQELQGSMEGM